MVLSESIVTTLFDVAVRGSYVASVPDTDIVGKFVGMVPVCVPGSMDITGSAVLVPLILEKHVSIDRGIGISWLELDAEKSVIRILIIIIMIIP